MKNSLCCMGLRHAMEALAAHGAVAAGLDSPAGGSVLKSAARYGVVGFKPTQEVDPGVLGNTVDDVIVLAGAMHVGAPWRDIPPHNRLGLMEGITLAVDELRRRNFSCQRIERHAWPGGAREAFALSDDAGAPVDYLVLRTGLPFDVTGVPAISLPIGPPDGVSPPAALQIVGKPGYDGELLQIAEQIERLLRQAWKPERRKNP